MTDLLVNLFECLSRVDAEPEHAAVSFLFLEHAYFQLIDKYTLNMYTYYVRLYT